MITLTKAGQPFATEQAAKIQASRLGLNDYIIVPHEDGYALETAEEIAMTTTGAEAAEATETVSEVKTEVSETPAPVKKHPVTTPWKPSSYLNIPKHLQVAGRRYRWCTTSKPGNIDKKIAEGWTVDNELTKKMKRIGVTIQDGKGLDSTLQVREMVVMWMPEELARGREKFYADRANSAQKSAQNKYRKDAKDLAGEYGGGAYGEVKIT